MALYADLDLYLPKTMPQCCLRSISLILLLLQSFLQNKDGICAWVVLEQQTNYKCQLVW